MPNLILQPTQTGDFPLARRGDALPIRPTRRMIIGSLLATGLLAGCSPGSGVEHLPPYDGTVYHLGVGDQLRVLTFGETSLSQTFRIGDGGEIAVPLLGNVRAVGLTTTQLADTIQSQLKSKQLLRNPSVVVQVETYRPISVLGEVLKPGQYPYQPGMTLLTAVASAGGFSYRAVENRAYVVRPDLPQPVVGNIYPQDFVKPGDVIKIYERFF